MGAAKYHHQPVTATLRCYIPDCSRVVAEFQVVAIPSTAVIDVKVEGS